MYLKELQENKNTFVLLLVAALCLGGYALSKEGEVLVLVSGLTLLPYGAVLVMPFILAHSFAGESKAQTSYQLLALPVPRWQIGLSKIAAVWTASTGVFALATGAFHLIFLQVAELGLLHGAHMNGADIWILGGLGFHVFLLLFMGIACVMEGVKQAVRRHRSLVSLGVFIGCFWLYAQLSGPVLDGLGGMGTYPIEIQMLQGPEEVEVNIGWLLYTGFFGLLLLATGLGLYDRFVEVE